MQTDDTRECAQNLTYDGSFIMGRTFKTSQYIHGVSKNIAVEKAARFLAAEGWAINNTDKELGIISASQTISFGKGKTAPLNVGIEPKRKGINVSITFTISGGTTTSLNSVKDQFCGVIEAIQEE